MRVPSKQARGFHKKQQDVQQLFQLFREVAALATDPKECLYGLTEVPSMRIFCMIKIIYLKGVNFHSNAFHNISFPGFSKKPKQIQNTREIMNQVDSCVQQFLAEKQAPQEKVAKSCHHVDFFYWQLRLPPTKYKS